MTQHRLQQSTCLRRNTEMDQYTYTGLQDRGAALAALCYKTPCSHPPPVTFPSLWCTETESVRWHGPVSPVACTKGIPWDHAGRNLISGLQHGQTSSAVMSPSRNVACTRVKYEYSRSINEYIGVEQDNSCYIYHIKRGEAGVKHK